ncbi:MAG: peptidase C39 family protein [Candidatus Eremiobacteraeota bacterium]|nr:peptidase C39 family protein [Candidatus Eremiobacteraeota bacterium]
MGNLILGLLAVSLTIVGFPRGQSHDVLSAVHAARPFTTAVASWNVQTPKGSWIETQLRARIGERWTSWYDVGHWSGELGGSHRHSVKSPADADGVVDTDTLRLKQAATAWQFQVRFHPNPSGALPTMSLFAVTTGDGAAGTNLQPYKDAWGVDIDVPERTQRIDESPDHLAGGGDAWCSPTSVSMVMAYWAVRTQHPQWDVDVPAAASGTFDPVYDGCGNWPFNVAFASEHGLAGWVERLSGMPDLEQYIAAGIPLIASIRVATGELDGSPYKNSDGHLLVVRGFTPEGDVIANDPYGRPGHIRIIYKRAQFEHVWMGGSKGIVYVIGPPHLLAKLRKRS